MLTQKKLKMIFWEGSEQIGIKEATPAFLGSLPLAVTVLKKFFHKGLLYLLLLSVVEAVTVRGMT